MKGSPMCPTVAAADRATFEQQANDSFSFKKSRRGFYVNPPVSRDWKWFQAGAAHARAYPPSAERGVDAELRAAAQAVVDRWDTALWKDVQPTADFIARLRAALAAQPAARQVDGEGGAA